MSKKVLTMSDLANAVPASSLTGSGDHPVRRCVHPNQASESSDLVFALSPAILALLPNGVQPAAIVDKSMVNGAEESLKDRFSAVLAVERPRFAQAMISPLFPRLPRPNPGVHPSAVVESDQIADGAHIGPQAFVGSGAKLGANAIIHHGATIGAGAVLGDDCIIHAGARIGDAVQLGDRVIIQPNAVIGGDGFAFETEQPGNIEASRNGGQKLDAEPQTLHRIESWGTVIIADDVEIGAGTTIDRAVVGATMVGPGTKIDNIVQIGHNTVVGSHCVLCSQVGIAGSSKIGDGVVLAGKVGIADHLTIGDNTVLMAKSGVTKSLEGGQVYSGMPAQPARVTLKNYAYINQLAEMKRKISRLSRESS